MSVAQLDGAMHRFASRHFGLIRFLGLSAIVSLAGSALSTHIASKLLLDTSLLDVEAEVESNPEEPEDDEAEERQAAVNAQALQSMADKGTYKRRSSDEIVAHNVFCPTCVAAPSEPVFADASGLPQPSSGELASSLP